MSQSRLVYSTQTGRHCTKCNRPQDKCICKQGRAGRTSRPPSDGIIRIRREVKGRRGKCVTTLAGFDADHGELQEIAARLKRACGTGGSVKDGVIVIQGDHRAALQEALVKAGMKVKLAGG